MGGEEITKRYDMKKQDEIVYEPFEKKETLQLKHEKTVRYYSQRWM